MGAIHMCGVLCHAESAASELRRRHHVYATEFNPCHLIEVRVV